MSSGLFQEFKNRLSEHRSMLYCVEENAQVLADLLLLTGLKKLRPSQLERMKRALKSYNIHTSSWSEK